MTALLIFSQTLSQQLKLVQKEKVLYVQPAEQKFNR